MSTEEGVADRLTIGAARGRYGRSVVVGALLLSAFCLSPSPSAQTRRPAPARSFFEPFDGLDGRRWYISDGWVNGSHQGCTWSRAAVDIKKGILRLSVLPRANRLRSLVCGEVQALGGAYGYGTYEVRMRAASGSGLNSAIFTYSGPPNTPIHDEIDFEFLGKYQQKVMLNYYVSGFGENVKLQNLQESAFIDFHHYAFVWQPDKVRWYVDGKLIRIADQSPLPSTPGKLYLSLWSGSSVADGWMGRLDETAVPATAEYDWVAYTAPGDRCLFPESITCSPKTK